MQQSSPPPFPSADWTVALLELLERQRRLVDELAQLARRQAELIHEGATDALLELLSRRQQIIDRFHASQSELARLTGNLDAQVNALDDVRRQRVHVLLSEIGDGLDEVMKRDESDQKALEEARDRARDELTSVDNGRQARRAYLGPNVVNNRFADRKG
jgi:hypothetical protein